MDSRTLELYQLGNELFESGKYYEAEALLLDIIKTNPNYADVHNKLGIIYHQKGELDKAIHHFEEALRINPRYTEVSLNLAVTYNDIGEFKRAQDILSKAAQIVHPTPTTMDPFTAGKLANEHYKLGNIYLELGLNDEAIEEYNKALRFSPMLADVLTKLGIALRNKGLHEDAIIQFSKAKEINPNYGPAWVNLGVTYYSQGLTGLAIEEWEEALRRNPDLKDAKLYLRLMKKQEE